MKKITYLIIGLVMAVMTACSAGSGYDQATVDRLANKDTFTSSDYREAYEQLSYLVDEYSDASDKAAWEEKNEKKAEAMFTLMMVLANGDIDEDADFPADLKEKTDKLLKSLQKGMF